MGESGRGTIGRGSAGGQQEGRPPTWRSPLACDFAAALMGRLSNPAFGHAVRALLERVEDGT
jgi:hypothetical protein